MTIPVRKAVRVLLLNEDKLLLMCVEDFDISTPDGKKNKRFWCTIGGGIEQGETITDAALREIYEETGIAKDAIELGPVVWESKINLMLKGTLTCLDEQFIVAKTTQHNVAPHMLTADEKDVIKKLVWFTIEDIKNSKEIIFPVQLPQLLPAIIAGNYPATPMKIGN